MTLSTWVDDTYVSGSKSTGSVYYGLDTETAGLASYCYPETAVVAGTETPPDGSYSLAVTLAEYTVVTVSTE